MSSAGIRAAKAYVEMGLNDDPLRKGLSGITGTLKGWASSAASVMTGMLSVDALKGAFSFISESVAGAAAKFDDISQRTGASAEALQAWNYAAEQSGATIDDVEKSVKLMQKGIGSGDKSFNKFGLSLKNLQGLSPDEQFRQVSAAIAGISDPTQRTAAALELFGKGGASLIPMLGSLDELEAKARDLGIVMSDEDVAAGAKLDDTIATLKSQLKGMAMQVGAALVPAMQWLGDKLSVAIKATRDWFSAMQPTLSAIWNVAKGIGAWAIAWGNLGWRAIVAAWEMLQPALVAAWDWFKQIADQVSGPVTSAFSGVIDWIKQMWSEFSTAFGAIRDAVSGGDIKKATDILWAYIKLKWWQGVAAIAGIWTEVEDSFYESIRWMTDAWDELMSHMGRSSGPTLEARAKRANPFQKELDDAKREFGRLTGGNTLGSKPNITQSGLQRKPGAGGTGTGTDKTDLAEMKSSALVTFSARAALGATSGPFDAIRRATERTAEATEEANRRGRNLTMAID